NAPGLDLGAAPGVDEVLDPRAVIDRERLEPGLGHEGDGIVAFDRQEVLTTGWERTPARFGPGRDQQRQRDQRPQHCGPTAHENPFFRCAMPRGLARATDTSSLVNSTTLAYPSQCDNP